MGHLSPISSGMDTQWSALSDLVPPVLWCLTEHPILLIVNLGKTGGILPFF